jgi:hypothetical protein
VLAVPVDAVWLKTAVVDRQLALQAAPEPGGGCRWRGPGMTARGRRREGRSLRDYSTDPAFRPGRRGSDGNPYWRTAMWDGTTMCSAFLAAGSALEELEVPHSGGGDVHSCVFAEVLVSASSLVFEPARESPGRSYARHGCQTTVSRQQSTSTDTAVRVAGCDGFHV